MGNQGSNFSCYDQDNSVQGIDENNQMHQKINNFQNPRVLKQTDDNRLQELTINYNSYKSNKRKQINQIGNQKNQKKESQQKVEELVQNTNNVSPNKVQKKPNIFDEKQKNIQNQVDIIQKPITSNLQPLNRDLNDSPNKLDSQQKPKEQIFNKPKHGGIFSEVNSQQNPFNQDQISSNQIPINQNNQIQSIPNNVNQIYNQNTVNTNQGFDSFKKSFQTRDHSKNKKNIWDNTTQPKVQEINQKQQQNQILPQQKQFQGQIQQQQPQIQNQINNEFTKTNFWQNKENEALLYTPPLQQIEINKNQNNNNKNQIFTKDFQKVDSPIEIFKNQKQDFNNQNQKIPVQFQTSNLNRNKSPLREYYEVSIIDQMNQKNTNINNLKNQEEYLKNIDISPIGVRKDTSYQTTTPLQLKLIQENKLNATPQAQNQRYLPTQESQEKQGIIEEIESKQYEIFRTFRPDSDQISQNLNSLNGNQNFQSVQQNQAFTHYPISQQQQVQQQQINQKFQQNTNNMFQQPKQYQVNQTLRQYSPQQNKVPLGQQSFGNFNPNAIFSNQRQNQQF